MAHAAVYRFEHPDVPALRELANGRDGAWWTYQEAEESVAYLRQSLKLPRHYCRSCDVPVGDKIVSFEPPKSAQQTAEDNETVGRPANSLRHVANHTPGVDELAARADGEPSPSEFAKARKPYTPQHARKATNKRWVSKFRKALVGIFGKKDHDCTDHAREIVEPPTDASVAGSLETRCVQGDVDGSSS